MSESTPESPHVAHPPPETWRPAHLAARALVRPVERFLHVQAASGLFLLVMAVIAMVWANSPWKHSYHHLWELPITLGFGGLSFTQSLHFWINDGLMVIFFFVVGLEIRREIYSGELSQLKRAAIPVAAAIGGMVLPALIYVAFNAGAPDVLNGWGVPMATDIAFAVGILALLGDRVPAAMRVLLLALAIIDDIGAILVIALFYSSGVSVIGLAIAAAGMLGVFVFQRIGIRQPLLYLLPGVVLWGGMLKAGVHPTIAGVILGLMTPVRSWFGANGFLREANNAIQEFRHKHPQAHMPHDLIHPLERINRARREAVSPVVRLESALHPWVGYVIMPLFALANAGVTLGNISLKGGDAPTLAAGVGFGLAVGKPLGVLLACFIAVKLGIGTLPRGVGWRGIAIVGMVAGIGFTMSLFIANLAFAEQELQLGVAKLSVLLGSLTAGVVGLGLGAVVLSKQHPEGTARTAAEAETSTQV